MFGIVVDRYTLLVLVFSFTIATPVGPAFEDEREFLREMRQNDELKKAQRTTMAQAVDDDDDEFDKEFDFTPVKNPPRPAPPRPAPPAFQKKT